MKVLPVLIACVIFGACLGEPLIFSDLSNSLTNPIIPTGSSSCTLIDIVTKVANKICPASIFCAGHCPLMLILRPVLTCALNIFIEIIPATLKAVLAPLLTQLGTADLPKELPGHSTSIHCFCPERMPSHLVALLNAGTSCNSVDELFNQAPGSQTGFCEKIAFLICVCKVDRSDMNCKTMGY
ncbi:hypothetical protein ACFFRR_000268 [Megaselia abdita]